MRHLMKSVHSCRIALSCTLPTLLALPGLLIGFTVNSTAQTSPSDPDSSLVELVHALPGTSLTLQRATSLAGATSPAVRAAAAVHDAALGSVRHEGGAFDPVLKLGWDYVDQKLPSASFFAGADVLHTAQGTGEAGLSWVSPIGTNIEATLERRQAHDEFRVRLSHPAVYHHRDP